MLKDILNYGYKCRSDVLGRTTDTRESISRLSWSRDRMDRYSLDRARSIVDFAYANVPFYKKTFDKVGYQAGSIRNWSDFEQLPILTKERLREAISDKTIFATNKSYKFTKASTTGSTGEPLTLYFDEEGLRQRQVNLRRLSYLFSIGHGEPVVQLWRKKKFGFSDRVAEYLGIRMTIPVLDVDRATDSAVDELMLDAIIDKVIAFETGVLRGYVSSLDSLAQRLLTTQKRIPSLRHIIAAAEALGDDQWKRLEMAFGCAVHNLYGGTEVPCIAVNICAAHEMSVFDDYHRLDLVKEDSDSSCREGIGRIAMTDYTMHGMPLIRYENGDLAEYGEQQDSVYPFRTLKNVLGRVNDRFILPNGKVVYSHLWHIFFRDLSSLKRFRVTQVTNSRIDIELEPVDSAVIKEKIPDLSRRVTQSLGSDIELNWSIVNHIPLDKGSKFRAVRSFVSGPAEA